MEMCSVISKRAPSFGHFDIRRNILTWLQRAHGSVRWSALSVVISQPRFCSFGTTFHDKDSKAHHPLVISTLGEIFWHDCSEPMAQHNDQLYPLSFLNPEFLPKDYNPQLLFKSAPPFGHFDVRRNLLTWLQRAHGSAQRSINGLA